VPLQDTSRHIRDLKSGQNGQVVAYECKDAPQVLPAHTDRE
jgi:hypothetical protein